MAELVMRVRAEYDSAIKLREELKKVEMQMKHLNENSSPQEIERLIKRHAELSVQLENGMSRVSKMTYYAKEAVTKIGNAVKDNLKDILSGEKSYDQVNTTIKQRLELEEKVSDVLSKQRSQAEESVNTLSQQLEQKKEQINEFDAYLRKNYTIGQRARGEFSEEDMQKGGRLQWEKDSLEEKLKDQKAYFDVYDAMLTDSTELERKLREEMEKLPPLPKELGASAEDFSGQVDNGKKKISELREELRLLKEERENLSDERGTLTSSYSDEEIDAASQKMIDLSEDINARKEEIGRLNEEINAFTIQPFEQKREELEASIKSFQAMFDEEQEILEDLNARQEKLSASSQEYADIQREIDEHLETQGEYKEYLETANKVLDENNKKQKDAERQYEANKRKVAALEKEVETLTDDFEHQNEILNSTSASAEQIEKNAEALGKVEDQIEANNSALKEANDLMERHSTLLNEDNDKATRVFLNENDYWRYYALNDKSQDIRAAIKDGVESGSLSIDELRNLEDELVETENEMGVLDEKARDTAATLGTTLGAQMAAATKNLYEKNDELRKAQRELDEYTEKLRKANEELERLRQGNGNEDKIKETQDNIEKLTQSVDKCKENFAKAKAGQVDALSTMESLGKRAFGAIGDGAKEGAGGLSALKQMFDETAMSSRNLTGILSGSGGLMGTLSRLMSMGGSLSAAGPYGLALAAVGLEAKMFVDYNDEMNRQVQMTQTIAQVSQEQAKQMSISARAIERVYDVDFRSVIESANRLMSQFGISSDRAMEIIKKGMQGMVEGDGRKLLSLIERYAPSFRDAGIEAEQLVAIIHNSEGGIFSEENMHAITMAIRNIRLMTNATKEALEGIGIDADEMSKKLENGSITIFDALKLVSDKLKNMPAESQEAGQAMQQMFGRQGVMAGQNIAKAIDSLNIDLEETKEQTGELGGKLSDLEIVNEQLEKSLDDAFGTEGIDILMEKVEIHLIKDLTEVVDTLKDVKGMFSDAFGSDTLGVLSDVVEGVWGVVKELLWMQTGLLNIYRIYKGLFGGGGNEPGGNEPPKEENLTPEEKKINALAAVGPIVNDDGTEITVYGHKPKKTKGTRGGGGRNTGNEKKKKEAQEIRDLWDYQEKLAKIEREAEDARLDAEIAAIQDNAERERREREVQHYRTMRELELQTDDIYHEIYEQRRKKWENAHKDSPYELTDEGKLGWGKKDGKRVMTLTEEEQKMYDLRQSIIVNNQSKERALRLRELEQTRLEEAQALREYLKEYGNLEEQRLAIVQEYEEKIRLAKTTGEKMTLRAQMDNELKEFDYNAQNKINFEDLFNNLQYLSMDKLQDLKKQLQEMMSGDMNLEQYKVAAEQIQQINQAILDLEDKQNSVLGITLTRGQERRRLELDVEDALQRQKELTEQMNKDNEDLKNARSRVLGVLAGTMQVGANGVVNPGLSNEEVSVSNADNILKKFEEMYGQDSEQYEKAQEALSDYTAATRKANETQKKKEEADRDATNTQQKLNNFLDDFKQVLADLMPLLQQINTNIQALPDLMDALGLGDTEIGRVAGALADTANNAMGAVGDFMSGNYVGALAKGISTITSAVGIFTGSLDNHEEMVAQQENANMYLDMIQDRVSRISDKLDNSYGANAVKTYDELREFLLSRQQYFNKGVQAAGDDRYGGNNSEWWHRNKNGGQGEGGYVDRIKKKYGLDFEGTSWQDFFNYLSTLEDGKGAEILNKLRNDSSMIDVWEELMRTDSYDHGAIAGWVSQWADSYEDIKKAEKRLAEQLTTTTEENVFDDFMNDLYALADGSEDVFEQMADNWQKMVNKMVINSVIAEKYREQLKKWYNGMSDELAELNKQKDSLSEEEYERRLRLITEKYGADYKEILKSGEADVNALKQIGLLKGTPSSEQSATANGIQQITSDQASAIEGRLTAIQIAQEQMLQQETLMTAKAEQLLYNGNEIRDIAADSRDILAGMAIHVEEIRDGMVETLVPRIKNIDETLTKVKKLVEEQ